MVSEYGGMLRVILLTGQVVYSVGLGSLMEVRQLVDQDLL